MLFYFLVGRLCTVLFRLLIHYFFFSVLSCKVLFQKGVSHQFSACFNSWIACSALLCFIVNVQMLQHFLLQWQYWSLVIMTQVISLLLDSKFPFFGFCSLVQQRREWWCVSRLMNMQHRDEAVHVGQLSSRTEERTPWLNLAMSSQAKVGLVHVHQIQSQTTRPFVLMP